MLEVRDLAKVFPGGVRAVDGCEFSVARGESLVVVGPSGCGKSTLLRLIAGLERPSAGGIAFDGQPWSGNGVGQVPPRCRDVAMVFQDAALYPHMTVRKNLAFPLRMQRKSRAEIERRIGEAAALLGIEDLLERRPGALSGGQRQRAALGRLLVRRPRCALLDEPLSHLEPNLRVMMRSELKQVLRGLSASGSPPSGQGDRGQPTADGPVCIYVTHDQAEAMTIGQRLAVMAEGRIQQIGDPLELYTRPANRFVAGFLGSPSMNFIRYDGSPSGGSLVHDPRVHTPPRSERRATSHPGPVLGVRPEHLRLAPAHEPPPPDYLGIEARVQSIEHLGDRLHVRIAADDGLTLVATASPGKAPAVGERLLAAAAPEHVHRFEPGPFGRRIVEE